MVKYRIKFSKTGDAMYVSHLDLMRLFSRVFRRAELPMAFSEGFNPHPKMSIGLPLSVGATGEAEYLDVDFTQEIPPEEIVSRMNAVIPNGVKAIACTAVAEGMAKLSDASRAHYIVTGRYDTLSPDAIAAFLAMPEIVIEKRTKRGVSPTDIRPDIFGLEHAEGGLSMMLAAGSRANLKPDVVLAAMKKYISGFSPGAYHVHRDGVWCDNGKEIM